MNRTSIKPSDSNKTKTKRKIRFMAKLGKKNGKIFDILLKVHEDNGSSQRNTVLKKCILRDENKNEGKIHSS